MENVHQTLKSIKTLTGKLSNFNTENAPATPHSLFLDWMQAAINEQVAEPNVMTLSTVDSDGLPDARSVVVLNVNEQGWHFAANSDSPKGRQMARLPHAAMTCYWPATGQQIRLRGKIGKLDHAAGASDFMTRPEKSRASILAAKQSQVMENPGDLDAAIAHQLARMANEPDLVSPSWSIYTLSPDVVEFWQSSEQRRFTRLRYQKIGVTWQQNILWP
ncbi:pyridoxal 5'-phosphate synthase [Undibacterium sp. TS12]|uniref:pyridoxine/pyridoxamine 5'-phosphate oxidase n=1 Tax=Undibacterium sp. TS12 TaxID=2908202 RepID=UPI001F4CAC2D|nr:pyridoxal 5'-phosphate synthase [Undibacterium sp. TS12]MCH8618185.1 pyridoxal 5'-phosphate synthase [Undibacterium sp. TS12]